jgi:hypothetical protein
MQLKYNIEKEIMMKKQFLFAALFLVMIVVTATVSSVIAQSENNLRINVNIAPGGLVVYSPPDYTTPVYAWGFESLKRGYSYEITFNVANTDNITINCMPVTIPVSIDWADVRFTPSSFELASGARQDVHIAILVHPDAPVGSTYFDVDFRGQ